MNRHLASALFLMVALIAIDIVVFSHPFPGPLERYHAALFAPPLLIIFVGAFRTDRIVKAHKSKRSANDGDGGVT